MRVSSIALLLRLIALVIGNRAEPADVDLRAWIPRMKVKNAHGGPLEKLSGEHRVVVVMTTIPPRIPTLEPVVDAMLSQTWPVEAVYLSVPWKYNRTGELYVIPEWLQKKKGLTILRCEDLGPGTHLLNGLRVEQDPWTFLAVVDDDHIYSPDLVETLMRAALANPGSAVAAQGFLSVPGLELNRDSPRYLHDQGFSAGPVLVSYLGVVYQRGFFDDSVFDYDNVHPNCRFQDDMWFSAHLARKGIKRAVLGAALGVRELTEMHLGPSSLTFWEDNRPRKVSEDCNDSLLRLQADLWDFRQRLVLAAGGLPPLALPAPPHGASTRLATAPGASPAEADEWRSAFGILQQLPYQPDLIYLCTADSGEAKREAEIGSGRASLGQTFRFEDVLFAASNACEAYSAEPRVGRLLRDVLQWEGDQSTVVVVGGLADVASQAEDIVEVAECAASLHVSDADVGSGGAFQPARRSARGRGGPAPEQQAPFCRLGGLAAVSVGGIGAAFG